MRLYLLIVPVTGLQSSFLMAQNQNQDAPAKKESKTKFTVYDGTIVAGYVDDVAYLNFTGPNLNWIHNNSKLILGMLPSLRIKEDSGTPKNSMVTPTLGCSLTYIYKKIAVQLPVYYTPNTVTATGEWNVGIGIGIRLKN